MRPHRVIVAVAVLALLGTAGCGGDDDTGAAKTASAPAATGPLTIPEVKQRLTAAGYTVADKPPERLLRRDDGGIVTAKEQVEVTGVGIPEGSRVSVHSFANAKDLAAITTLAGAPHSLISRSLFFQSAEPGAAETVAKAAAAG